MLTRPFSLLRGALALAAIASFLAGCGGGSVSTQSVMPAAGTNETPQAATSTFCVTPTGAAQTATLPNTAGFTGTLALAASAAGSACDLNITLATGADAAASSASERRTAATNQTTTPILQLSLDNAFANNVAINGATLNTPADLSFPDGTYNAVITSGSLPPTGLTFVAKNGVLTLQITGSPIIVIPGTTATISLYARGVTPVETAAPTASPSASASATPTAIPSATASPTVTPLPSPTATAAITATVTLSPGTCVAYGNGGSMPVYSAIVSTNAPPGTTLMYGWQGTSDFSVTPNASYTQYDDPSNDELMELSSASTATVTIGMYPQGSLAGAGGSIGVFLFYVDPVYHQVTAIPATGNQSHQASAYAQIEAGSQTCPS